MEDKQIVELFACQSEDAIKEIEAKYGMFCFSIASNILGNKEDAEKCVEESYARLTDTIPPRRPKNLKAYLGKITRYQALYTWKKAKENNLQNENMVAMLLELEDCIPDAADEKQIAEQYVTELAFEAFLKEVETEQRKLFVARYWYLATIVEIASYYKMDENKMSEILFSLREKLREKLKERQICLTSEDMLYAMTEIDDRYLEEAELRKKKHADIREKKEKLLQPRIMWWSVSAVCVVALTLVVAFLLKFPGKQPSIGTSSETEIENKSPGPDKIQIAVDADEYIQIYSGDRMKVKDFKKQTENLPWNENMTIAALPIYKNLATRVTSGEVKYLDEETLLAMIKDVAAKLDMKIIESSFWMVADASEENVCGIHAMTDFGAIEIDGDGEVYVTFTDGVKLPPGYESSDSASIEDANKMVDYCIAYYDDLLPMDEIVSNCYVTYDLQGNPKMNYQAVSYISDVSTRIAEYYLNQIQFYYDEQKGLTGFRYRDYHVATELVDYYPIITLEEAKELFQKELMGHEYEYEGAEIQRIELMYRNDGMEEYYQPYFCFYLKWDEVEECSRFYIPAAQGASLDGAPQEPEVKIMNLDEYETHGDMVFYKEYKYFTVGNGGLVEGDRNQLLKAPTVGQTEVEHTLNGTKTYFYYGDSEVLNLDEVIQGIEYHSLGAMYLDGKILIIVIQAVNGNTANLNTSCYIYSTEDGSLTQTIEPTPSRGNVAVPLGLTFYGGRYATKGDMESEIIIVDALEGTSVGTGIPSEDVYGIYDAGESYFAMKYNTGEVAIVDKASGQILKKTKFRVNFPISDVEYKEDMLYIESWSGGNFVFVISEFE